MWRNSHFTTQGCLWVFLHEHLSSGSATIYLLKKGWDKVEFDKRRNFFSFNCSVIWAFLVLLCLELTYLLLIFTSKICTIYSCSPECISNNGQSFWCWPTVISIGFNWVQSLLLNAVFFFVSFFWQTKHILIWGPTRIMDTTYLLSLDLHWLFHYLHSPNSPNSLPKYSFFWIPQYVAEWTGNT